MNLPHYWAGMSFTAKANYLCETYQVKSFKEACAFVKGRKKKALPVPKSDQQKFWWNND